MLYHPICISRLTLEFARESPLDMLTMKRSWNGDTGTIINRFLMFFFVLLSIRDFIAPSQLEHENKVNEIEGF